MYKTVVRPLGLLVGLELMRNDPVLNSYIFNGFNKKLFFFHMIIRLKPKSINTIMILIKLYTFPEKQKAKKIPIICNAA